MKKIPKTTAFQNLVYGATAKIPRGKISTYGDIARSIGKPRSARAVGNALNANPFAPKVPCHRVIRSSGEVGGFAKGCPNKIKLLKKEGVKIIKSGRKFLVDSYEGRLIKPRAL